MFGEVCLATRRNLNPRKPPSRILSACVESTTTIVRFVVLAITKFDDSWLSDQLNQPRKHISIEITFEGFHDPEELR
jgi:hypothetical protein